MSFSIWAILLGHGLPMLVKEVNNWWNNRKSTPTVPTHSPTSSLEVTKKWQEGISEFQKEIANEAEEKEKKYANYYKFIFEKIVDELEKSSVEELKHFDIKIDFGLLKNEIAERSKSFDNIARDYINIKINLSNDEFKQIGDEKNITLRDEKMKEYGNNVIRDAGKKLIEKFQELTKDTGKKIEEFVTTQTTLITNRLDELQQTYINLSGSKEEVDKELLRTGEIEAIITLIETTAQEKISV
jgi:hypothetical protein